MKLKLCFQGKSAPFNRLLLSHPYADAFEV